MNEDAEEHGYGTPDVPRFQPELALRGIVLAVAGIGMIASGWKAFKAHHVLLLPVAVASIAGGVSSLWAAVIHLSGGERFDDHPFL